MIFPNAVILIFAKAPVPGKVKTRLGLSGNLSATVFSNLLVQMVDGALCDDIAHVQLCVAGDTQHPFIQKLSNHYPLFVSKQVGDDLGERMDNAIQEALKKYQSVILVGADCLAITGQDYFDAFEYLQAEQSTVVIQPALDGGYVMVASNCPCTPLFKQVSWGTNQVLKQTLVNAKAMLVKIKLLKAVSDIDYLEDIKTLYLGE